MKRKQLNLAECWKESAGSQSPELALTDESDSDNDPEQCHLVMLEEGSTSQPEFKSSSICCSKERIAYQPKNKAIISKYTNKSHKFVPA